MSSPIRMSGMVSGLDTESIVTALTSDYQNKVDKYKKAQTKLSWKQDAWKEVNTEVNDFYNSLDKYRYSSAWSLQKATVSDATKATVSTNGKAFNGTQTLEITQLATSASLTSGKLSYTDSDKKAHTVTSSTKISDIAGGTTGDLTIKVGDKDTTFTVDSDTTVNDLVNALKTAGLNASFDETQQRFYISSKSSGKDQSFSLSGSDDILKALKLDSSTRANATAGQDAIIKLDGVEYNNSTNNFSIN